MKRIKPRLTNECRPDGRDLAAHMMRPASGPGHREYPPAGPCTGQVKSPASHQYPDVVVEAVDLARELGLMLAHLFQETAPFILEGLQDGLAQSRRPGN